MTREKKKFPEMYLGDGVYASFDGHYIVLDLRAQDNTTRIAMEPFVLDALDSYRRWLADFYRAKAEEYDTDD